MIRDPDTTQREFGDQDSRRLLQRLSHLDPVGRRDALLEWLVAHPQDRLDLGARNGMRAVLDDVDLGSDARDSLISNGAEAPSRWLAEGTLDLRQACFAGACCHSINLSGALLSGAILADAQLGRADFSGANLEEADLRRADLAQASLRQARLGEANLANAMLEDADLRGMEARYADFRSAMLDNANLEGADLWGAVLEGAELSGACLRSACLNEANLVGADLKGADLQRASLRHAKLRGANLAQADLQDAVLAETDLEEADLSGASLQGVSLLSCRLRRVRLCDARLEQTRLRMDQLGGVIGEEVACEYDRARGGYLALEQNFRGLGDPDAASWAHRRKRRMQKRAQLGNARAALDAGAWRSSLLHIVRFCMDQAAEWLCDYGESIPRVIASIVVTYLIFVALYGLTGSLAREAIGPDGTVLSMPPGVGDLLVYTLLAMTTSGPPDTGLKPTSDLIFLLGGVQGFVHIVLLGLLGFVLGNRIHR